MGAGRGTTAPLAPPPAPPARTPPCHDRTPRWEPLHHLGVAGSIRTLSLSPSPCPDPTSPPQTSQHEGYLQDHSPYPQRHSSMTR